MKNKLIILFFIILTHCSFDNKTGIWQGGNIQDDKKKDQFRDFQELNTSLKSFNTLIKKSDNYLIKLGDVQSSKKWNDEFYNTTNNLDNFSYPNNNDVILISKKLTTKKTNDKILFDGENFITTDIKGNIIVYSLNEQKITFRYNFYKKRYKKIEKKLKIIIEENIVYVADNIGFFYSLDYKNKRLVWAFNNKIPFRSNIKIYQDNLILADQDNSLHIVNKIDGKKVFNIPTTKTILKNNFINSLSLNKNTLIYLNTYGSLYSFNTENFKINWFININQNTEFRPGNLFFSNPVIIYDDKVIVSSNTLLQILDLNSGRTIFKKSITSVVKPIVSANNLFLITNDNLLVCINISKGEIIFSLNIADKIANYLETKKRSVVTKSIFLIKNDLYIFLNNSFLIKFNIEGKIKEIIKLKKKLLVGPIFYDNLMMYIDKKNKLIVTN
tara:strand:+ start:510 stop:1835 length:1326 start_codon:yes stop_codon:yes gene_type:complete